MIEIVAAADRLTNRAAITGRSEEYTVKCTPPSIEHERFGLVDEVSPEMFDKLTSKVFSRMGYIFVGIDISTGKTVAGLPTVARGMSYWKLDKNETAEPRYFHVVLDLMGHLQSITPIQGVRD